MTQRKKKLRGVEALKRRDGLLFVTPWMIGIAMFFIVPLFQSIQYTFSDVSITTEGVQTKFTGLDNYRHIFIVDPRYVNQLRDSLIAFLYTLPLILIVSLILALMLNQKFRGRLFFRALFFLPVIIATGNVMKILLTGPDTDMSSMASESMSAGMFSVSDVMGWLSLPPQIADPVSDAISRIFDLLWSSGIPIVLFIAGLQTIPASLYEASHVEGATKWEEFWMITFPMLSRITVLVALFTMVEQFTNMRNTMIQRVYNEFSIGQFANGSAMVWIYFVGIIVVLGLTVGLFQRYASKRWG